MVLWVKGLDEPVIVAEFHRVLQDQARYPHAIACRALEVSRSWFYKWINRKPTVREQRRADLDEEIKRLFTASGGTYGSPPRPHRPRLGPSGNQK
ncbi:hypothetical protein GCM10010191_21670 [Actinomadura vinacea]|uniref:Transposase n=1 Tax=Actinomadura vinacea TaxID=115336 RepID=A0ABN3ITF8_9ACTN